MSAKQNFFLPRSRGPLVFCQLLGLALLLLPCTSRAQSLEDAAHELAMKVCLGAQKQPVKIAWLESPQSSAYLTDARRKIFLDQISACGMAAPESSDASILRVSIQATPSKALLIASFSEASRPQIYAVEIPRAALFVVKDGGPAPRLRSELLWQQEKPVHSAVEWQDPSTQERLLFLLTAGQFERAHFEDGAWKMVDSTDLPAVMRPSRSGGGSFLFGDYEHEFQFLFYKKLCHFNPTGSISLTCKDTDFGGKVVALSSDCEDFQRILTTDDGDDTQADRVILKRPSVAGAGVGRDEKYSASLDMPGPVLDISAAVGWKAVFAVVKNLSTGNYEVYRITAVCGN